MPAFQITLNFTGHTLNQCFRRFRRKRMNCSPPTTIWISTLNDITVVCTFIIRKKEPVLIKSWKSFPLSLVYCWNSHSQYLVVLSPWMSTMTFDGVTQWCTTKRFKVHMLSCGLHITTVLSGQCMAWGPWSLTRTRRMLWTDACVVRINAKWIYRCFIITTAHNVIAAFVMRYVLSISSADHYYFAKWWI